MGLQKEARQKFAQDKTNTGKTEANGVVRHKVSAVPGVKVDLKNNHEQS